VWLVLGFAVVPLIAVAAIAGGWWLWKRDGPSGRDRNEVRVPVDESPAPAGPPAAPVEAVSDEPTEAALQEAAAEAAKRLDGEYRMAHSAKRLIEPGQLNADWIQKLARGDLDAIPDSLPTQPDPEDSASYQSLYDSLYTEALAYLRERVSREGLTNQAVRDAAREWEHEKRAQLETELTEILENLSPGRQ
jgi:hypothetical protein